MMKIDMQMTDSNVIWRLKNDHEDLGQLGECVWAAMLNKCGFMHIPLSTLPALNGRGPRLQGNDSALPDFEVTAGVSRRRVYMDSKCKSGPVLFKIANEWRQGIDRRAYENYRSVSGVQRQQCMLGIIELFTDEKTKREWSGAILVQSLSRLGEPISGFNTMEHMVFWPRNRFFEVGSLQPVEMYRMAGGYGTIGQRLKGNLIDVFGTPTEETVQTCLW